MGSPDQGEAEEGTGSPIAAFPLSCTWSGEIGCIPPIVTSYTIQGMVLGHRIGRSLGPGHEVKWFVPAVTRRKIIGQFL